MTISGISAFSGMGQYRITSIHGNPYSMSPIQEIGEQVSGGKKPLVIASAEKKEDLYVKNFGELEKTTSTAIGDFAEILEIEEAMTDEMAEQQTANYAKYLNDTIGMMGFQNRLRNQLTGVSFEPF
ncbi:MAG: hypothetical protein UHN47_13735 [Lachnospiraceae bacterium]|nr:hypothetical protein [Lachnospiraceae bacterium]